MLDDIKHYIEHSIDVKTAILNNDRLLLKIYQASQLVISSIRRKGKILIAGNGGSAADAMHMATEFTVKFYSPSSPLAAIALSSDSCVITAAGNDFNFEYIFSRQIEALGRENDVFIAISTSGTSKNILNASIIAASFPCLLFFSRFQPIGQHFARVTVAAHNNIDHISIS